MELLKVTYDVVGLFSLKQFGQGHLNNRSYDIPMNSTIRGALLGMMIKQHGLTFAMDNYETLRSLYLFVQAPKHSWHNQLVLNRITNRGFSEQGKITQFDDVDKYRTVGIRGMVHVEQIVFYIEDNLEGLREYLHSIQTLGDSESQVGLRSIEPVKVMEDVLVPFVDTTDLDKPLHEMWDWKPNKPFDKSYGYSTNRLNGNVRTLCYTEQHIEAEEAIKKWNSL